MRLILFIAPLTLASCFVSKQGMPRRMDAADYCAWAQSERYPYRDTQTVASGIPGQTVRYVLEYRPREVEIAALLKRGQVTADQAAGWLREESTGMELRLTILTTGTDLYHYGLRPGESAGDRAAYYAVDFRSDVRLITGADSLKPSAFLHEKGLSGYPAAQFRLDFAALPAAAQRLVIRDPYFGGGWVEFSLANWNADGLPRLQLSSSRARGHRGPEPKPTSHEN